MNELYVHASVGDRKVDGVWVYTQSGWEKAEPSIWDGASWQLGFQWLQPPNAPANVQAQASTNSITLTWQLSEPPPVGEIRVYRSTTQGFNPGPANLLTTLSGGQTQHIDTSGLAPGVRYYYRIGAANAAGESISQETTARVPWPPSAPINVQATPSATSVTLTWTLLTPPSITEVRIYRSTTQGFNPGPANLWATLAGTATQHTDSTLITPGQTYYYRVGAANADGVAISTEVSATIPAQVNPPPTPSQLQVSPSGTSNLVSWQDNSTVGPDRATSFQVEVSTNGGASWSLLATVPYDPLSAPPNTYSHTHQQLAPDTVYTYRVRATNAGGPSSYSNTASGASVPNAPSSLQAAAMGVNRIDLTWQDNSQIETGYEVHRSTTPGFMPGAGTLIHTTAANATSYQDTTVQGGTTYYYKVRARNTHGHVSAASNEASATTSVAPAITDHTLETDGINMRARMHFDVGMATESVEVQYEFWVGGVMVDDGQLQIIDTTPGGTGYTTDWYAPPGAQRGDEIVLTLIPWSGNNATGTPGTPVSDATGPL